MSYADKLGVPYVVFLGEDEVTSGGPVSVQATIRPAGPEQNTLAAVRATKTGGSIMKKLMLAVSGLPCCAYPPEP